MENSAKLAAILRTSTGAKAIIRAMKLKLTPTCGRCGGSGHYSFNQIDGSTCYGCRGAGHVPPKTAAQWTATIEGADRVATNGELDHYLETARARRRCKEGKKRAFDAWHALEELNRYGDAWRNKGPDWETVKERNAIGVDLIDALDKLDKGAATDWIAYERALTEGIRRLAETTEALKREKVEG